MDSGRGVAIAIGNEDLSSIRIVKEPSDLECFDSTKVKICVLSISSRGQKGRAPKCIKGHEMRFIPQTRLRTETLERGDVTIVCASSTIPRDLILC